MRLLFLVFTLFFLFPTANATMLNGDFSDSLNVGWGNSFGDIQIIGGEAVIRDDALDVDGDGSWQSSLTQIIGLESNTEYTYRFNLATDMQFDNSICGGFCFPDWFVTSLYLSDTNSFSIFPEIDLYDSNLGFDPAVNFTDNGNFYSVEYSFFNTSDQYAMLTFDLLDFDFVDNSSVTIDDVVFEKVVNVSEPETLALFLLGIAGVSLTRRYKKSVKEA